MILLTLILLQSPSRLARLQALNLLDVYNQAKDDSDELLIFTDTDKPKSTKKPKDRQDFTPLKLRPVQKLFKSILAVREEIIADR